MCILQSVLIWMKSKSHCIYNYNIYVQTPYFVCSRRKVVYGQVRDTIFFAFLPKNSKKNSDRSQKMAESARLTKIGAPAQ